MNRVYALKEILWVLAALGGVAILVRLIGGLGVATDLSDAMPWGLWKIVNMVAGVALATGGFALAATVYVFGASKYRSVVKPAILIAFLGYGSSCFALFLDIGLPHAIWKPLLYWNPHSFLFEVAWCVMLYFTVTILEMAPPVLEKHGYKKLVKLLHKITIPIVITGITFSTLHHTSLGSLFLVMPTRLHDLWFTSAIPILFIFSAVGAGIQMVILMSLAYSWLYRRPVKERVLKGLAKGSAVILGAYLALKIADLLIQGKISLLVSGQWETGFFFAELILGVVIPVGIIATPSALNRRSGLATASLCAILGLVLNRANVGIMGLLRTADVAYFPSLTEITLCVGILSMATLAMLYLVEHYRIFEDVPALQTLESSSSLEKSDSPSPAWSSGLVSSRTRVSMLVTLAISISLGFCLENAIWGTEFIESTPVCAPLGLDAARKVLKLDGDRNEKAVLFPHQDHQHRLGGDESCRLCHHLDLPEDHASACHRCHMDMRRARSIFDHERHISAHGDKWSCIECHETEKPKNLDNSKPCHECHLENMGLQPPDEGPFDHLACAYRDAMHGRCVPCHKEEDRKGDEIRRSLCSFCHEQEEGDLVRRILKGKGGSNP